MKNYWEHSHSGVFARDLEHTVRYYQSLGLAPVLPAVPRPQLPPGSTMVTIEFGEEVHLPDTPDRPFLQLIYIGDLELEVLRAPEERPEGEALAYAEGINHVCFNVPDIDRETEELVAKGLRIVQDAKRDGVRIEDYLDTREYGTIFLSLRPLQTEEAKKRKAGYGIVDWKFHGHTAVVRDLDKTINYYRAMDIAEFQPQGVFDSRSVADFTLYGKTPETAIKAKTGTFTIGPVTYELVQPLEGDGIYRESLDRRGEGIIDLVFTVDDLEAETARLVGKGVPVVLSGKPRTGKPFAWFDTRKEGGDAMIKLVQR